MPENWTLDGWPENQFLREYSESMIDGSAALFCGAGTSIAAGMIDWRALLRPIADDLGLEMDRVTDLLSLAQYGHNEHGRQRLNERIIHEFVRAAKRNRLQDLIVRLPIDMVWTTNYDQTLEQRYRDVGQVPDVKMNRATIAARLRGADVTIYKMHGDVSQPDDAVLTKDDYERYGGQPTGRAFRTALEAALFSRTFLFVGFSFNDPNLEHVLSQVRTLIGESARHHFCIMRRPARPDGTDGKERAEREYEWRRMQLQIVDLKTRYNVRTVLVDTYVDVESLLERLGDASRSGMVFVSGAVEKYAPFDRGRLEGLLAAVGRGLERNDKTLVSGMGIGIGSVLAQSYFLSAYEQGAAAHIDGAVLRPFPVGIGGGDAASFWETHRRDMIGRAGFVLYACGNKIDVGTGAIVASDGMEAEFQIAREYGAAPIPIGATVMSRAPFGNASSQLPPTTIRPASTSLPTWQPWATKMQQTNSWFTPCSGSCAR